MNEILMVMGSYCVVIILGFMIIAWLQAGFLMPFLKVKMSRGKKILVKVRKTTGTDFVAADEIEGLLVFKYFKEQMRLSNYKKGIYRSFNLNCVDVEPEKWAVITVDFEAVSTNEPNKTDSLIERGIMKPHKIRQNEIVLIILLIVAVIGIVYIGYKLFH